MAIIQPYAPGAALPEAAASAARTKLGYDQLVEQQARRLFEQEFRVNYAEYEKQRDEQNLAQRQAEEVGRTTRSQAEIDAAIERDRIRAEREAKRGKELITREEKKTTDVKKTKAITGLGKADSEAAIGTTLLAMGYDPNDPNLPQDIKSAVSLARGRIKEAEEETAAGRKDKALAALPGATSEVEIDAAVRLGGLDPDDPLVVKARANVARLEGVRAGQTEDVNFKRAVTKLQAGVDPETVRADIAAGLGLAPDDPSVDEYIAGIQEEKGKVETAKEDKIISDYLANFTPTMTISDVEGSLKGKLSGDALLRATNEARAVRDRQIDDYVRDMMGKAAAIEAEIDTSLEGAKLEAAQKLAAKKIDQLWDAYESLRPKPFEPEKHKVKDVEGKAPLLVENAKEGLAKRLGKTFLSLYPHTAPFYWSAKIAESMGE